MRLAGAVRSVAIFEAAKGALVLVAGLGLLALVHQDLHALAAELIRHLHLNPASHYPRIFIDAADRVGGANLTLYALGAAAYSCVRFVEAYGLWRSRAWAEWLAAASGGIYIPFELYELVAKPSWLSTGLVVINVAIVALMLGAAVSRLRARERS